MHSPISSRRTLPRNLHCLACAVKKWQKRESVRSRDRLITRSTLRDLVDDCRKTQEQRLQVDLRNGQAVGLVIHEREVGPATRNDDAAPECPGSHKMKPGAYSDVSLSLKINKTSSPLGLQRQRKSVSIAGLDGSPTE